MAGQEHFSVSNVRHQFSMDLEENLNQPVFPINFRPAFDPDIQTSPGVFNPNNLMPPYGSTVHHTGAMFEEGGQVNQNFRGMEMAGNSSYSERSPHNTAYSNSNFHIGYTPMSPYNESVTTDRNNDFYMAAKSEASHGNPNDYFIPPKSEPHGSLILNHNVNRVDNLNARDDFIASADRHMNTVDDHPMGNIDPDNLNYLIKGATDKDITGPSNDVKKDDSMVNSVDESALPGPSMQEQTDKTESENTPVLKKESLIDNAEGDDDTNDTSRKDVAEEELAENGETPEVVIKIEPLEEEDEGNVLEDTDDASKDDDSDSADYSDTETVMMSDYEEEESAEETHKNKKTKAKGKKKLPIPKKKSEIKVKLKSKSSILTEKKEHKCTECGKIVNSLRAYEKHLNLHTDKFSCSICKKCFNSQTSLDTHQKVHEGFVGNEKCNVCDKTFYDKSSLNKHTLSVHMGIKNFECQYCDRSFFARKTYEEHVRVHTGERPFKCDMCPKAYKRVGDLNHHIRLHKGETKHTCEFCGEGFRRVSELNRHTQKHKSAGDFDVRSPTHICEWCNVRFSTAKALKQHVSTHFESMCFDKSMMQKAYGESKRLVDNIVQDLSSKFLKDQDQGQPATFGGAQAQNLNLLKQADVRPSVFGYPTFGHGTASDVPVQLDSFPGISGVQSTLTEKHLPHDQSLNHSGGVKVACSIIKEVTKDSTKGVNVNDQTNTADTIKSIDGESTSKPKELDSNSSIGTGPVNISNGKISIKTEHVEEYGESHMYIGSVGAVSDGDDDDDVDELVSAPKQEYEGDTDVEDYAYIIKDDDDHDDDNYDDNDNDKDEDYIPSSVKKQTKVSTDVAGPAKRKRNRKGKPTRRSKKTKTVKITNEEVLSEMEDIEELDITESINDIDDPAKNPASTGKGKKLKSGGKAAMKDGDIPNSSSYVCEECGKVFSSKPCFKKHMNLHSGVFSCGICGKSCVSRYSLEVHEASHEGKKPKPAVCNVCDKTFYDPSSMNKHVKNVHMNYRPHACTECDRKFPERKTLVEHLRTHTGERPFKCEDCGKTYKRKSELNFHKKLHTGETKLTCEDCGKGFRRNSELKHHNVVYHSGERQYCCSICLKKFTTKPQLNDHTLRHYGIRNFECTKCFRTFYTKSKLRRHMKMKRDCTTIEPPVNGKYICKYCLSEYDTQQEMRTHVRTTHEHDGVSKSVYSCKVCWKEFSRSQALKRHMKIHTQTRDYVCNACGVGFIQKHHLIQHERTHTGEKPYTCTVCFKSFAQNATLYSHMKHHSPRELEEASPKRIVVT